MEISYISLFHWQTLPQAHISVFNLWSTETSWYLWAFSFFESHAPLSLRRRLAYDQRHLLQCLMLRVYFSEMHVVNSCLCWMCSSLYWRFYYQLWLSQHLSCHPMVLLEQRFCSFCSTQDLTWWDNFYTSRFVLYIYISPFQDFHMIFSTLYHQICF